MKKWQKAIWQEVIDRDEGLCIYCGRQGCQVHHVIARSALPGKANLRKLWQLKNMCCVCLDCNQDAHTVKMRVEALRILQKRHGYDYSDRPFVGFVQSREDS